jgi:hypothetical protein
MYTDFDISYLISSLPPQQKHEVKQCDDTPLRNSIIGMSLPLHRVTNNKLPARSITRGILL